MSAFKRRRSKPLRFKVIPLAEDHPDWLELDREIPAGHLARRIRHLVEQLDLSELLETYSGVGVPIVPPDLLLAFVLFEMQEKRPSPAEWFKSSRETFPARWLLKGFRPARAVFYRFRDHLPAALLLELNRQVLLLAQSEAFTTADRASVDGTFTAAYGSRHRLLTSAGLAHRLGLLAAALACTSPLPLAAASVAQTAPLAAAVGSDHAPSAPLPANRPEQTASLGGAAAGVACNGGVAAAAGSPCWPYWMAVSRAGRLRQQRRYVRAQQILHSRLIDHHKRQTQRPKAQRKSAEEVVISANEPEAVMGKDKCKVFRPLYNTQVAQDLDSAFVLGYGLFAQANDVGLLPPMLQRTKQLTGKQVKEAYADGSYATLGSVRYCQQEQVQLYAPTRATPAEKKPPKRQELRKQRAGKAKEKYYGKEKFTWQEQEQSYRCPQGHLLQLGVRTKGERRQEEDVEVQQYRCAKEHCQKCPQARQCTSRPDKGRTIKRMQGQELLDEVTARMATAEAKAKYKRRSQTVEPRHGDLKQHRGLWGFSGYGKEKGESAVGMLVLAHNGLSLLKARAKRKRTAEPGKRGSPPTNSSARPTPQPAAALPNLSAMPAGPPPGPPKIQAGLFYKVADNDDWLSFN